MFLILLYKILPKLFAEYVSISYLLEHFRLTFCKFLKTIEMLRKFSSKT